MTHCKQILVLEGKSLATASLLSLLLSRSGFDVINTPVHSLSSLDPHDQLHPDVIILEEELLAANMTAIVNLANHYPKVRLIIFNLSNNTLQIFDKQIIQVQQVNDFLELL